MREISPPHFVRCFLVEFFLGSSSTIHNDQNLSEQNSGHVLIPQLQRPVHETHANAIQLSCRGSEKWNNLPRR